MEIEVRLFATLREGRFARQTLTFPRPCRLSDVLRHLQLDRRAVAILLVNGQTAADDPLLQSGDQLSMFPAVGGG